MITPKMIVENANELEISKAFARLVKKKIDFKNIKGEELVKLLASEIKKERGRKINRQIYAMNKTKNNTKEVAK